MLDVVAVIEDEDDQAMPSPWHRRANNDRTERPRCSATLDSIITTNSEMKY